MHSSKNYILVRFEFFPVGFFSRLVGRFLETLAWQPLTYWRNGIVLEKDKHKCCLAVIEGGYVTAQEKRKEMCSYRELDVLNKVFICLLTPLII